MMIWIERAAVILVGSGVGCSAPAGAEDESSSSRSASEPIIVGTDDRAAAYRVTDPRWRGLGMSTAAVWLARSITEAGGYSTVTTTRYTHGNGLPLCADTKFYNQRVGSGLACTAFLVAPGWAPAYPDLLADITEGQYFAAKTKS